MPDKPNSSVPAGSSTDKPNRLSELVTKLIETADSHKLQSEVLRCATAVEQMKGVAHGLKMAGMAVSRRQDALREELAELKADDKKALGILDELRAILYHAHEQNKENLSKTSGRLEGLLTAINAAKKE